MKDRNHYDELLKRYLARQCTLAEVNELMDYLESDSSNRLLLKQIKEQFASSQDYDLKISPERSNQIRGNILRKIDAAPVIRMRKRSWRLTAAAAAIILIVSGLSFFKYVNTEKKGVASHKTITERHYKNDVPPGADKALLTLADGSIIVLDDARNGQEIQQGKTKLLKLNGKIVYSAAHSGTNEMSFNTVQTPRGGQYHIELPDGTQVWLNAASSLHFPTAFAGKERRVEITGEAYFEVAKNKDMPFIVKVNTSEVRVLGTHFNIMAYKEEPTINTTLLEGSVKFVNGSSVKILQPGQQAQSSDKGPISLVLDVDADNILAWKNGFFHFENADLETVLRQMSRWYDVEVVYKKQKPQDLLYVDIPRNTNLSDALKALELASGARFEIEEKKIIVML